MTFAHPQLGLPTTTALSPTRQCPTSLRTEPSLSNSLTSPKSFSAKDPLVLCLARNFQALRTPPTTTSSVNARPVDACARPRLVFPQQHASVLSSDDAKKTDTNLRWSGHPKPSPFRTHFLFCQKASRLGKNHHIVVTTRVPKPVPDKHPALAE